MSDFNANDILQMARIKLLGYELVALKKASTGGIGSRVCDSRLQLVFNAPRAWNKPYLRRLGHYRQPNPGCLPLNVSVPLS
jgi:hypothetical protein